MKYDYNPPMRGFNSSMRILYKLVTHLKRNLSAEVSIPYKTSGAGMCHFNRSMHVIYKLLLDLKGTWAQK